MEQRAASAYSAGDWPVEQAILEDILVFVGLMATMGCITGIIITTIKWRRSKLPGGSEITAQLSDIAERLARLEQSVDSTALEVERISEGQRFTTKLLASKEQPDPAR